MKWLVRALVFLSLLVLAFLGVGYWNATRPPQIVQVRLPLEGLPEGRELKVLHLTDTHFGYPDMRLDRLLRIAAQANSLKPDMIVLTGDYIGGKIIDWPASRLEEALVPLSGLKAPLGVWAVTGNHDPKRWTEAIMGQFKQPVLLRNEVVDVGPVLVAGLNSMVDRQNWDGIASAGGQEKPVLILMHEGFHLGAPYMRDRLKWFSGQSVLALAGHTHGGQVKLPFVYEYFRKHRPHHKAEICERGYCEVNGWRLFVSSGIGTSVLPIRYGVPPEMVMLTLYSTGKNSGTDK